MEHLFDLAKISQGQAKILEVTLPSDHGSPLRKLYNLLHSETRISDSEAMVIIYGKKNLSAFSRLKTRLKDMMYLALLIQNNIFEGEESRASISFENFRKSLCGRALMAKKHNKVAYELMEKAISKSLKYNITENILYQSRILVGAYAGDIFNKYKYNKYVDIQNKYLNVFNWEIKAENYFFDLQKNQYQSLANPSEELKAKALNYCKELEQAKEIKTAFFTYNKYRVFEMYYEYNKDYESILKITESALKEFSLPRYKSAIVINNMSARKMWALIQSGQLKDAINFGKKIINKLNFDSHWYRIAHYTLKAYLYLGEYRKSIELMEVIVTSPKYAKLKDFFLEIFNTTLGYMHLIIDAGLLENEKNFINRLPEFKIGKFLNETPVFSKDKRGINVSILLMHIAFLLQRKNFNAIIDRTDSLNQYAYRYLRRDDSFRSNCMIKMVIQMTKADFHPVRTERYTADLRKQLSSVNLAGSGENIEIEIIPFEVLWDIMMKSL